MPIPREILKDAVQACKTHRSDVIAYSEYQSYGTQIPLRKKKGIEKHIRQCSKCRNAVKSMNSAIDRDCSSICDEISDIVEILMESGRIDLLKRR